MKKSFLVVALALASMVAPRAFAATPKPYVLADLDKLGTCKLGTVQEENAEMALSYLTSFVTWHIGDQVAVVHPDFVAWHSSIAGLLEVRPEFRGKIPPDKGQYTKKNYVETMAFLAYHNDIDNYEVVPTRVDCVGKNKVILISDFHGFQLQRNAKGCVTHKAPFGSPTKITIEFKDYEVSPGVIQKMVVGSESHLDDTISAKVREDLAKIVATQPALPEVPSQCKTQQMIFDEFNAQVVQ